MKREVGTEMVFLVFCLVLEIPAAPRGQVLVSGGMCRGRAKRGVCCCPGDRVLGHAPMSFLLFKHCEQEKNPRQSTRTKMNTGAGTQGPETPGSQRG